MQPDTCALQTPEPSPQFPSHSPLSDFSFTLGDPPAPVARGQAPAVFSVGGRRQQCCPPGTLHKSHPAQCSAPLLPQVSQRVSPGPESLSVYLNLCSSVSLLLPLNLQVCLLLALCFVLPLLLCLLFSVSPLTLPLRLSFSMCLSVFLFSSSFFSVCVSLSFSISLSLSQSLCVSLPFCL